MYTINEILPIKVANNIKACLPLDKIEKYQGKLKHSHAFKYVQYNKYINMSIPKEALTCVILFLCNKP